MNDLHRPRYHFVIPEARTMPADPNGAIWWRGRYHLMYIFQRPAADGDGIEHCWGHASSPDLVSWTHHPPALTPEPGDVDRHIFSGNAFLGADGRPRLMYHGVSAGNCLAEPLDDDLIRWRKLPHNPIVPIPAKGSPEEALYSSWDPHGWLENGRHLAIFGGKLATVFTAPGEDGWRYVGPLLDHDLPGIDDFEDISCPDFFPFGDGHALLCISHARGCRLYTGRWDGAQFHPERHFRMNWPGGTNFAPESLLAPDGRRLFWTWVIDPRPKELVEAAGWSGVMALPRELSPAPDGIRVQPARELQALRGTPTALPGTRLAAGEWVDLDAPGDQSELALSLKLPADGVACLEVRRSPDGRETTPIVIDRVAGEVRIELDRSSLDASIRYRTFCIGRDDEQALTAQTAPYAPGDTVTLRVFLDGSILEVYVDEGLCLTQRLFPTLPESTGLRLGCRRNALELAPSTAWPLKELIWG